MRIFKRFLATAFMALTAAAAAAQEPTCMPLGSLAEENLAFMAGEKLDYTINFKWGLVRTDIASASLTLAPEQLDGRDVLRARLTARTARFYDNFFKVREDFNAWFDAEGLIPRRFTRDTREGGYIAKDDFNFVWETEKPYIAAGYETKKKPLRNFEIPLKPCTYDVLSLFYTARNMDMSRVEEGKPYPMVFAIDDDIYTIRFIFRGRETRDIKDLGPVNTMKFEVSVVEGEVFTGEGGFLLWFSDDANRIPVYFEAGLKIGMVKGWLSSAEGLRHESRFVQ